MKRQAFNTAAAGVAALLLLALSAPAVDATPYTPQRGDQVIETLARRGDPAQQELYRLRLKLSADPRNLTLATTLAQRYIAMARGETDPRYLGYAQAALAPWWAMAAPPAPVRLLRARLLQENHRFTAALADLDAILAAEPNNLQAWLARATVLTVQGDYPKATLACARVSALSTDLVTVTCLANVAAMTGRAARQEQLLALTLERSMGAAGGDNSSRAVSPELQVWSLTLLAEMAARRGDAAGAETRYRRALALAPHDAYLSAAYADFLLDQHRPDEVLALVRDQTRVDTLLLRRALALQMMPGQEKAQAADEAELSARFKADRQRGDIVHRREQARFELALRQNPAGALELARQNWAVQKEAPDMRVYLEAALQADDAAAAAPVADWVRNYHVEDVAVRRLLQQLKTKT